MGSYSIQRLAVAAAIFAAMVAPAAAHTGVDHAHGFSHGFMHPMGGLDHILAMVAAGMFAAQLGGRALWLVPVTFVAVMALGGALGMAQFGMPFVEIGIAVSVIVLGLAVALRLDVPTVAAMALVGFFALFHGHAHGAEMPLDASGVLYATGFMLATACLHLAGIGIGIAIGKAGEAISPRMAQASGVAMSLAGVGLLTGIL